MRKKVSQGSALPIVLWILAILFIISMSFPFVIGSRIKSMEMLFNRFNAHLKTYSSLQYGMNLLLTGTMGSAQLLSSDLGPFPDGNRYFLDGSFVPIDLFNGETELSFQEESGLVNLRLFQQELIDGLMKYFGADQESRAIFFDSLMDWVDSDDLVRLHGAEKDYYENLGYRPRNDMVLTPDEILLIKGMEEEIFQKIRPFIFLGKSGGLNPNTALFEVLMSLPDMTEAGAREVLEYRRTNPITSVLSFSSVCKIDYTFYESLFDFGRPNLIYKLKARTKLGKDVTYTMECHVQKIYGPPITIEDFLDEISSLMPEKWAPIKILLFREIIE